jgi:hypothetical protein
MKINPVIVGLLMVLAFLAGRWSSGNPSATPANPATADAGGAGAIPPAAGAPVNQPWHAQGAPALPAPAKPAIAPGVAELPVLPDTPGVVRNTGPFIDPDPDKPSMQPLGPDQPVRNSGAFVDPGGPPQGYRETAAVAGRK